MDAVDWDSRYASVEQVWSLTPNQFVAAELDESDTLDAGDPHQLAAEFAELRQRMPSLTVLGGCCGTDARHVAAIARAVV